MTKSNPGAPRPISLSGACWRPFPIPFLRRSHKRGPAAGVRAWTRRGVAGRGVCACPKAAVEYALAVFVAPVAKNRVAHAAVCHAR